MLTRSSLQQLQPRRIANLPLRLRESLYTPVDIALTIFASEPTSIPVNADEVKGLALRPVTTFPHVWGRLFYQRWWKVTLASPAPANVRLHWRDQAEATVYVDGVPWHGIDNPHRYVPLPEGVKEFWVESNCCNTGIWEGPLGVGPAGSIFEGASLVQRDDERWRAALQIEFLYDLFMVEWHKYSSADPARKFGVLPEFDNMSTLARKLNGHFGQIADAWELGGVRAMRPALDATFAALPAESWGQRATLTGHSHLDLVWQWPEKTGEAKAVHTFSTQCRLMERYPEFIFGYTQPASYEAVERRSPELMKQVRRYLAAGRWEATGGFYVESDTQLSCGEGLARSFMIGQEGFLSLTGKLSRVVWLPDVFGYTGCLPQLMRLSGVDAFFTAKAAWNLVTRFPHTSFVWRGPDGAEVISHILNSSVEGGGGFNGAARASDFDLYARNNKQASVFDEFLLPTGYGDGGGGPSEEMLERARCATNLAGLPRVGWGRIEDFFDRLGTVRHDLPVHYGEIYLEFHRGVQTTHRFLKVAFRGAERALQALEAVRSATQAGPIDPKAWKRVVFGQFHDCIPGSSYQEVYEEFVPEMRLLAETSLAKAASELGGGTLSSVFNPLPLPRVTLIEQKGKQHLVNLPPLAGRSIAEATVLASRPVVASTSSLANGRVLATFDAWGRSVSVGLDGAAVPFTGPANEVYLLPDWPAAFDAWDVDGPSFSIGRSACRECKGVIEESTPLRAVLAFTHSVGERSRVTVRYSVEAESLVLNIRYDIDWQDERILLKAAFPTAYRGRDARYGAPFGSILRGQQPGRPHDEAAFEVPASRWAVVQDDGGAAGLAVISESTYGFGAQDGLLHVSLVRSTSWHGADECPALRDVPELHSITDLGAHRIELAITRTWAGAPRAEQPATLAETLYTPVVPYTGAPVDAGLLGLEGGESLLPSWAQPLEGGSWVLRLHETLGRAGTARLQLAPGRRVEAMDLLGRSLPGISTPDGVITFTPYQVISLRVSVGRSKG